MNLKLSKLISYIILCVAGIVLFCMNTPLFREALAFIPAFSVLHIILVLCILVLLISPLLGILMHLFKAVRIIFGVLLFVMASGIIILFSFSAGMIIGDFAAIFTASLLPALFTGAHFVCIKLANPSKTAAALQRRGVKNSKIVRITSFKAAYAEVFRVFDYIFCICSFVFFASSFILGNALIITLPAAISLVLVFSLCSFLAFGISIILDR